MAVHVHVYHLFNTTDDTLIFIYVKLPEPTQQFCTPCEK